MNTQPKISAKLTIVKCLLAFVLSWMVFAPSRAEIIWSETFEGGWGLWSASNGEVWGVGTPSVGPELCFGGLSCAATGLTGSYPVGTVSELLSPSISLPAIGVGEEIHLRWWQWVNYASGDYGYQKISFLDSASGNWLSDGEEIGSRATLVSNIWVPSDIEITSYATKKIKLMFGHVDDNYRTWQNIGVVSLGRYIDNVTIERISPFGGSANLSLSLSADPEPLPAGGFLTYMFVVKNNGPDGAHRINVTHSLSDGSVKLVSTPRSGCGKAGSAFSCPLGDLAAGGQIKTTVVVSANSPGIMTNNALVTSHETDTDNSDNSAFVVSTILPLSTQPDLAVSLQDIPGAIDVGTLLPYGVSVVNLSSNAATGVALTIPIPNGVQFVSASTGCNQSGNSVVCSLGNLAAGAQVSRNMTIRPTLQGILTLSASVAGTEVESNTSNNSAVANTTVNPSSSAGKQVDLAVSFSDYPDPVIKNGSILYVLAATNRGPDTATGVTASVSLPAGMNFSSASSDCIQSSGSIVCSLPNLAAGSQAARVIVANPTVAGDWTASATVSGQEVELVSADNTASATTAIVDEGPKANLGVFLKAAPKVVRLGKKLTYVLSVVNIKSKGSAPAPGVTAVVQLPNTVSVASVARGCAKASNIVTCQFGTLKRGVKKNRVIVVKVNGPETLQAGAYVSAQVVDPDLANNHATVATAVKVKK